MILHCTRLRMAPARRRGESAAPPKGLQTESACAPARVRICVTADREIAPFLVTSGWIATIRPEPLFRRRRRIFERSRDSVRMARHFFLDRDLIPFYSRPVAKRPTLNTLPRDLFPGALEMMILESLRRQPAHGYALVQHIQQRSNNRCSRRGFALSRAATIAEDETGQGGVATLLDQSASENLSDNSCGAAPPGAADFQL